MNKIFFFIITCAFFLAPFAQAQNSTDTLKLQLVYPRAGSTLPFVKQSFVFGHVSDPAALLTINGSTVPVYRTGSFIGTIPFQPGEFKIMAEAKTPTQSAQAVHSVMVSSAEESATLEPLVKFSSMQPVQITVDEAVLRTGPSLGAEQMGYDLFLKKGIALKATGKRGTDYRIQLTNDLDLWVDEKNVQPWPNNAALPNVVLSQLGVSAATGSLRFSASLDRPIPYRARWGEDLDSIHLTLYYAISNLDRIAFPKDQVRSIRWEQTSSNSVDLWIQLTRKAQGYAVNVQGNQLLFEVFFPPKKRFLGGPLSGWTIALDPGHSSAITDGAIGPQGIQESEICFAIAQRAKTHLQKAGANVFITKTAEEEIALSSRSARAVAAGAQLFLSIHANALPDGADFSSRGGFSVYYFQPHSLGLAAALHAAYQKEISELKDDGFYYGNLAVCRITQMPSALLETGYLILPSEEELLLSNKFQDRIAQAIVKALTDYVTH